MFTKGQKVVCIRDDVCRADGVKELVKGNVYTVRWCGYDQAPWLCVRLAEIFRNDVVASASGGYRNNIDCPFNADRFRPLTDISIFHEILRKATKKQPLKVRA